MAGKKYHKILSKSAELKAFKGKQKKHRDKLTVKREDKLIRLFPEILVQDFSLEFLSSCEYFGRKYKRKTDWHLHKSVEKTLDGKEERMEKKKRAENRNIKYNIKLTFSYCDRYKSANFLFLPHSVIKRLVILILSHQT